MIAAALLVLGSAALAGDRPRLQALNWTAAGSERAVLLEQPATCLDPGAPREAAIGEALFHAPALLGGQAERAGLSCAGCHANGRSSAHFFLEGISGVPGTADISTSFFAVPRANAMFDPRPIPDLATPGKVSHDRDVIEPFLRGLIVEEFSGAEPSPMALTALAAYVRALQLCSGKDSEAKKLIGDLNLVIGSVEAAIALTEQGEGRTARILVKGARFRLGLIAERMAGRQLASARMRLLAASRRLALAQGSTEHLANWRQAFTRDLQPALQRLEPRSLYAPRQVDHWLADRR